MIALRSHKVHGINGLNIKNDTEVDFICNYTDRLI